jgi:hypothetical protein
MRYYELINPTRGYSTQLSAREWEMLRALAVRYGWEPEPGRNYAREGTIGDADAAAMATAVKQALRDVPIFYAAAKKELLPPNTLERLRYRPGDEEEDPLGYFSGHNRTKLLNFINAALYFDNLIIRALPEPSD